jgi:predicted phosphodiesterase
MDEPALKASLPTRRVVESQELRIGLVHDAGPVQGRHERLRAAFPECDLIAYGHTHLPELARVGETWIANPGSPTERRRAPQHTMVLIAGREPELVALDR